MRWRCNTARDVKMLIKYFRPSKLGLNNHADYRGGRSNLCCGEAEGR